MWKNEKRINQIRPEYETKCERSMSKREKKFANSFAQFDRAPLSFLRLARVLMRERTKTSWRETRNFSALCALLDAQQDKSFAQGGTAKDCTRPAFPPPLGKIRSYNSITQTVGKRDWHSFASCSLRAQFCSSSWTTRRCSVNLDSHFCAGYTLKPAEQSGEIKFAHNWMANPRDASPIGRRVWAVCVRAWNTCQNNKEKKYELRCAGNNKWESAYR